jgi:hypothetical protein
MSQINTWNQRYKSRISFHKERVSSEVCLNGLLIVLMTVSINFSEPRSGFSSFLLSVWARRIEIFKGGFPGKTKEVVMDWGPIVLPWLPQGSRGLELKKRERDCSWSLSKTHPQIVLRTRPPEARLWLL